MLRFHQRNLSHKYRFKEGTKFATSTQKKKQKQRKFDNFFVSLVLFAPQHHVESAKLFRVINHSAVDEEEEKKGGESERKLFHGRIPVDDVKTAAEEAR